MTRLFFVFALAWACCAQQRLDLAPFARPCCSADKHQVQTFFDYAHPAGLVRRAGGGWVYGFQWAEERDVEEIHVRFTSPAAKAPPVVQYWFRHWPLPSPASHTVEDRVDDLWQGEWIAAKTEAAWDGTLCRLTFLPLEGGENPNAKNLPGVRYRRAIKLRILFPGSPRPAVTSVQVFSPSPVKRYLIRLRMEGATPRFGAYNGWIRSVRNSTGGVELTLDGSDPRPPGSNDATIVKVSSSKGTFSFIPSEAERGPMYLPDFDAYIALVGDATPVSPGLVRKGSRIRERIEKEPDHSFERASREIPPLDPVERSGGRLMLILAPEASWQKFGLEWGGNVVISKRGTKAKGNELSRLTWPEDMISWRIGTGETPSFREAATDSTLFQLEDYLPVGIARWRAGELDYEEEAFATLLAGPLSPEDPRRSEQTPAVLMARWRVRNTGPSPREADVWLAMRPGEPLGYSNGFLTAAAGRDVRAHVRAPAGAVALVSTCRDGKEDVPALRVRMRIGARERKHIEFAISYVPGLSDPERQALAALQQFRPWHRRPHPAFPDQGPPGAGCTWSRPPATGIGSASMRPLSSASCPTCSGITI